VVTALIQTAQLDALCEDLPKVIADAADEQLSWASMKVSPDRPAERDAPIPTKPSPIHASLANTTTPPTEPPAPAKVRFWAEAWQFKTSPFFSDAALIELASRKLAQEALAEMTPSQLVEYFRHSYVVGSETAFVAIPRTVLADLGARGIVIAEHALVGGGKFGTALRENGLYRLIVHWPLRLIAAFTAFLRRSPHSRRAFIVGAALYLVLALVTNLFWWSELYAQSGAPFTVAVVAFVMLPLVAFLVAWVLWRPGLWRVAFLILVCAGIGALGMAYSGG
jgi:hypothetical protein